MRSVKWMLVTFAVVPWTLWAQTSEWNHYHAKNGAFSISLPRPPIEQTQASAFEGGAPLHLFAPQQQNKKEPTYVVMYRDLPTDTPIKKADPRSILNTRQQGIVKIANGKLIEEKEISLDQNPGREFIFEREKVGLVRCQLYLVDKTLYHLSYFSFSQDRKALTASDAFFDSFHLSKK